MIDGRQEARRRRDGLGRFPIQGRAKSHSGSNLWAEKGQTRVAAAEMKRRRAAVLGAGGGVVVSLGSCMCQVALGHEMDGALDHLSSTRYHGQGQE